jgi:hypothetical protein
VTNYPRTLQDLAEKIHETDLLALTQAFLTIQLGTGSALADFLQITTMVNVIHSATVTFFAPSNPSGIWGMQRKCIWATPLW